MEKQNVNVMKNEGFVMHPAVRNLYPTYTGIKMTDNRNLYQSLKRSYVRMGNNGSNSEVE